MPRAYFTLSIITLLAVACGDDTVASSSATDTSSTTATDGTTDAHSSNATTGDPDLTTSTTALPTTDATTTSAPDTGPDTTSTSGPDTTTGGPGVCGVAGESVSAELAKDGQPAPCGPLEFTGSRKGDAKGPVWQLDGCACGSDCLVPDPWTFTMQAPAAWLPLVPDCPRIVVDRAMGFGGCEFVAVSVWDLAAPGAPAVYHAGHGFSPTQAGAAELALTAHSLGTCACDGCCGPDELWDLQFSLGNAELTLSEGESGKLGAHDAIDFESHQSGLCDASSSVHWAVRLPG